MALGEITLITEIVGGGSPIRMAEFTIVGDSNYPSGGTAGFEATLRAAYEDQRELEGSLSNLRLCGIVKQDATIALPIYDRANDKLVVRTLLDGSEMTGDQDAVTYRVLTIWS